MSNERCADFHKTPEWLAMEELVYELFKKEKLLGATPAQTTDAAICLTEAILAWRKSLKYPIAATRKELGDLHKAMIEVLDLYDLLSPHALGFLMKSVPGPIDRSEAAVAANSNESRPQGEYLIPLRRAAERVGAVVALAECQPNKQRAVHRNVLAYKVAWVLKNELGIEPTGTRDVDAISVGYKGAHYDRLLRGVLKLAGLKVPGDIAHIMEKGLDLLNGPALPEGDAALEGDALMERRALLADPGLPPKYKWWIDLVEDDPTPNAEGDADD